MFLVSFNLIVYSNKRLFRQFPRLLSNEKFLILDNVNLLLKKEYTNVVYCRTIKNIYIKRFLYLWISCIASYRRFTNKLLIPIPLSNASKIHIAIGLIMSKSQPLKEYIFTKFLVYFVDIEFLNLIKRSKLIIIHACTTVDEWAAYYMRKYLEKKIILVPDGYDTPRKCPIPLRAYNYYSFDKICTSKFKEWLPNHSKITTFSHHFKSNSLPVKTKLLSVHQLSIGRSIFYDSYYLRLYRCILNIDSKSILRIRLLPNEDKDKFIKYKLKLNNKRSGEISNKFLLHNGNFNFEDNAINEYLEFISGTSILFLFVISHAIIEYSISGVPVVIVYDQKKASLDHILESCSITKLLYSAGLVFISFYELSIMSSLEELMNKAKQFDINKIIYNNKGCPIDTILNS